MRTDERTQVHIYGQVYHLKGGNDAEHTEAVAKLVDEQMNRVAAQTRVPDNFRVAVLTALHLADEYLNAKKDHDKLKSQVTAKSNHLVSLLDKINNEEESASVSPRRTDRFEGVTSRPPAPDATGAVPRQGQSATEQNHGREDENSLHGRHRRQTGRRIVRERLSGLVGHLDIDLVIANCENTAAGFGITADLANQLFETGIDVLTSGNHIFDRKGIGEYLAVTPRLLRPANYPDGVEGHGVYQASTSTGVPYAVLNLQGRVYLPTIDCPFRKADELLDGLDGGVKVRLVDFHAEVTSEKIAFGWYLDGRVSAVVGTHTHVPTADERVLPQGTAYITDAGNDGALRFRYRDEQTSLYFAFPSRCSHALRTGDWGICAYRPSSSK